MILRSIDRGGMNIREVATKTGLSVPDVEDRLSQLVRMGYLKDEKVTWKGGLECSSCPYASLCAGKGSNGVPRFYSITKKGRRFLDRSGVSSKKEKE